MTYEKQDRVDAGARPHLHKMNRSKPVPHPTATLPACSTHKQRYKRENHGLRSDARVPDEDTVFLMEASKARSMVAALDE